MPRTARQRIRFAFGLATALGLISLPHPAGADPTFGYVWTGGLELYDGECPHFCRQRAFAVTDAAGRTLGRSTLLYSYITGNGRLVRIVIDRPDVNYRYSANDLAVIRTGPKGHHVAGVTSLDQAIDRALLDFVHTEVWRDASPAGRADPAPVAAPSRASTPPPVVSPIADSLQRARYAGLLADAQTAFDRGEFAQASASAAKALQTRDTPEARELKAAADRKEADRQAGKVAPRAPKRPKGPPPPVVEAGVDPAEVEALRTLAEYFLAQWRTGGQDYAGWRARISPAFLRDNPQPAGALSMFTISHDYAFLERAGPGRLVYILGSKADGTEQRLTLRFRQEGGRWYLLPRATRTAYYEPWERLQRHGTY